MEFLQMAKRLTREVFIMNRVHITLARAVVALVVALSVTTPTLAAVCNNVTFSLTNISAGPILEGVLEGLGRVR